MIFRALFLTIASFAHVLPSAAQVGVYQNFLKAEELEYLASIPVEKDSEGSKTYSSALLDTNVANRIHKVFGVKPSGDVRRSIAITHMGKTTERHADAHYGDDGEMEGMVESDEKVGFIFLETNPQASFSHGEDIIPSEAGTLVMFDGSKLHNTIVNKGSLSIAGPFQLDSLKFVGEGCNFDGDCPEGEECECGEPIRRLSSDDSRNLKRRAAVELATLHNEVVLDEENDLSAKNPNDSGLRRLGEGCLEKTGLPGSCIPKPEKSTKSPKKSRRA